MLTYMFYLNEEGIRIPSMSPSDIEVFSCEILNRIRNKTYYTIFSKILINIHENMTEVKTGRGRAKKATNVIEVNNIKLEYIITKTDNYQNEISYLKVIDKQFKKLKCNRLYPRRAMSVSCPFGNQTMVFTW